MSTFHMRPYYDVLLRGTEQLEVGIYQLHLTTAEQLCRLHYSPGSLKMVKRRLKALADNGYVQVSAYAVKYRSIHGNPRHTTRYAYVLGPKGAQYLATLGMEVHPAWRPAKEEDRDDEFMKHTLQLNDVIIAAAKIRDTNSRLYLADFRHERELKRQPYKVTIGNRSYGLIPDAYLDFRRVDSVLHFPVLLEHDNGTEEHDYFKRKVRAYLAYLKAKAYRDTFGTTRITVAFTTFRGDDRMERMRAWTQQVILADSEPWSVGSAFRFASLSQPLFPGAAWLEPRWRTAYDDEPQPLVS